MGFTGNNSNAAFEKKFYIGKENFKITLINPTKTELENIGFTNQQEEPQYVTEQDGKQQVRIAVYADNGEGVKTTINFYIVNSSVVSKTGKVQVINKYGQTTWLPEDLSIPENMQWYKTDGMRKSFKGEEEFVSQFLTNYLNTSSKKGDACSLENPEKLFSGDFSEIKQLTQIAPENKVGALLGVKKTTDQEGKTKYVQTVYTKHFLRQWAKSTDKLAEELAASQAAGVGANVYYGSAPFKFQEVKPESLAWETADSPEAIVAGPAF